MGLFPKVSKSEWLAKIEKDLKGKPLSTLDWEAAGLNLGPIYTSEDISDAKPLPSQLQTSWQIGCRILVKNDQIKKANTEALSMLNKGANALCFVLEKAFDYSQLPSLLKDIQLEWIATHFELQLEEQSKFLATLGEVIESNQFDISNIDLSISNSTLVNLSNTLNTFPSSRCATVSSKWISDEDVNTALGELLHKGNETIKVLRQADHSPSTWNSNMIFQLTMTDHYFLNIAKIRALKLLWAKVLESWDAKLTDVPFIEAHVSPKGKDVDDNYNKIRASSQALSAAVARVDRMYIYPSDMETNQAGTVFTNRIALNINHLLLQESKIGMVQDPSAGSYFIEQLTDELCTAAWSDFQKRQKKQ